jgi:hypothetical protein
MLYLPKLFLITATDTWSVIIIYLNKVVYCHLQCVSGSAFMLCFFSKVLCCFLILLINTKNFPWNFLLLILPQSPTKTNFLIFHVLDQSFKCLFVI